MTNRNSIQNSLVWQLLFYKILKPAIDKRRCGSLSVVVYSLLCKLYWKIFYRKYSISGVVTTWHKVPDEDIVPKCIGKDGDVTTHTVLYRLVARLIQPMMRYIYLLNWKQWIDIVPKQYVWQPWLCLSRFSAAWCIL